MTTPLSTNVIAALWDRDDSLNAWAQRGLDAALARGNLVIPAPVYAELMAFAGRTEAFLDSFFEETSVTVVWEIEERVWRTAGLAFLGYADRRRRQREVGPRRILADFVIGAFALRRGASLLTLDERIYRAAFPTLSIVNM